MLTIETAHNYSLQIVYNVGRHNQFESDVLTVRPRTISEVFVLTR
jgi:hypothetical protein